MRDFSEYNPITLFVYFAAVLVIGMFSSHPVISALSLLGALSMILAGRIRIKPGVLLFFLVMFLAPVILNPVFDHHGLTVLLVVNDNPITLESVLFGLQTGVLILAALLWFRSFSHIFTSDKLLYIFGTVSPKFALLLSMTLRYIPLFTDQTARVNEAQKAIGLYKEDNVLDSVKGGARVFSVMVTWALENGIVTADSMEARGYGVGRRSFYALYRFAKKDVLFLAVTLVLFGGALAGMILHGIDFSFYPVLGALKTDFPAWLTMISFGILSFLPSAMILGEELKWKFYQSKI